VVADWASVKGECHGSGCREDACSDHLNSNGWPLGSRSQHVEYCAYYKPSDAESEEIIANPVSQANRFDTFFVGHFFARLLRSRAQFSRDSSLRRGLKAKSFLGLNGTDESVTDTNPSIRITAAFSAGSLRIGAWPSEVSSLRDSDCIRR
jgi:hypothetical protein